MLPAFALNSSFGSAPMSAPSKAPFVGEVAAMLSSVTAMAKRSAAASVCDWLVMLMFMRTPTVGFSPVFRKGEAARGLRVRSR